MSEADEEPIKEILSPIVIIILIILLLSIGLPIIYKAIRPLDSGITKDSVGLSTEHNYTQEDFKDFVELKDTLSYIKIETSSEIEKPTLKEGSAANKFELEAFTVHKEFALDFEIDNEKITGIKNVLIKFKMKKQDLMDKNTNPKHIKLAYRENNGWKLQGKKLDNEDGGYYRYTAGVPYSDSYAIVS